MSDLASGVGSEAVDASAVTSNIGADGVADQLVAGGVSTLFGVPGVQLDFFVDALARRQELLTFISCRPLALA